jgi:aminodeoxychorismate synthase, component I, bacterial clade
LFSAIALESWSIFLDSCYPHLATNRYDIFSCRPYATLTVYGNDTIIRYRNGHEEHSLEDPFLLIKRHLGEKQENRTGLPFCGGAMGYFAYDLGRRIENLPETAVHDIPVPDMAIGLFDWSVVVDHHQRRSWLVGYGNDSNTKAIWQDLLQLFHTASNRLPVNFTPRTQAVSNLDKSAYARAFERIKRYIIEGDCYQVNLAQRFTIEVNGSPWDAYLRLRNINPAPFSCFFNLPDAAVLSSSPERFLKVSNGLIETKPIKGTRRRSMLAYEDRALAVELLESEKDRAENLMIVDLLRNDLGKNCITGTVSVPKLFALESYATVHHLVSTITGRLRQDRHALDLLRGCFPGGSITGAPKVRAMQIIEELEPHRRNVYCGSIGYIGFDGNMDSNIAIRTLLYHANRMYCWAGGGIVVDSVMDAEYQECFDKVAAMLHLLATKEIKEVGS